MQLRWSHAVLYVRDVDAMVSFYTDVMGFEVADRGPILPGDDAPEIVFLSQVASDHHQLALLGTRAGDAPSTTLDHMAFRVDSLAQVREMKERVEKDGRGERMPSPVTHGNAWSVYFADPEGNGIEVFCDSPFHVPQPQIGHWDPSQTDEEVVTQTRADFQDKPGFGSFQEYLLSRAEALRKREEG